MTEENFFDIFNRIHNPEYYYASKKNKKNTKENKTQPKKKEKKKWNNVHLQNYVAIPTILDQFSGHFSGHYLV